MVRKVIMDVDTGSDDAIAIMLAAHSPELDILGITVTWGNREVEYCTENTLRVVQMLGKDIPVYKGCPQPMVRYMTEEWVSSISTFIDGKEVSIHPALLDLPESRIKAQKQHAVSYIVETLMDSEEKITFITVGPPTNLGMAFRMEPAIKDHLEEVVFMGGGVNKGNASAAAEANFYHDPEAAKIIIDSGVPCRIITLNATHSAELTLDDAEKLISLGSGEGKLAGELLKIRIDSFGKMGRGNGYSDAIHDALAVACVVDPSVITDMRNYKCDIDIGKGLSYGELIVDKRLGSEPDENDKVYVAFSADKEKYLNMLLERLK